VAAEIACALMKSAVLSQATELRDQLQEQLDTAALVSMAQGVLMAVHSCSQAQARDLIVLAAEENRETLVTVAERILSTVDRDGQANDVDRSSAIDI
jgi:AmiR/NasT family two-component response regulator